jgi:hypothetical protein
MAPAHERCEITVLARRRPATASARGATAYQEKILSIAGHHIDVPDAQTSARSCPPPSADQADPRSRTVRSLLLQGTRREDQVGTLTAADSGRRLPRG